MCQGIPSFRATRTHTAPLVLYGMAPPYTWGNSHKNLTTEDSAARRCSGPGVATVAAALRGEPHPLVLRVGPVADQISHIVTIAAVAE